MDRTGIFAGSDPFEIAKRWLAEANEAELNDPNAMALASADASGMPNVRMVLLKEIEVYGSGDAEANAASAREGSAAAGRDTASQAAADGAFVFYTNYDSVKGDEITASGMAAFVLHWKSLRRQIRVRGHVTRVEGEQADAYYRSRDIRSRLGAWASRQSQPLSSREALLAEVAKVTLTKGPSPARPPFWGGFRIRPIEIEFWADGAFRLHDRFRWCRSEPGISWEIERLSP